MEYTDHDNIKLWENIPPFWNAGITNQENTECCTLTPYLIDDGKKHPCIIICPGGAFVTLVNHEGAVVAKYLNQMGLSAMVLNYRVMPYPPNIGVMDAMRAVRHVRFHAEQYNIYDNQIGIIGFSAGGFIACYAAEQCDTQECEKVDEIDCISARPDACAFCYAPLSFERGNVSSEDYNVLLRMFPDEQTCQTYLLGHSCHNLVTDHMPPAFIWHNADDNRVPAGASIDFVKSMQEKRQSFEFHIFPVGGHGIGVEEALQIEGVKQWPSLYGDWLKRQGFVF